MSRRGNLFQPDNQRIPLNMRCFIKGKTKARLRKYAENEGCSMRELVEQLIEDKYGDKGL